MRIWIDADACPVPVKDIVFRASRRLGVPVTLVANRPLSLPRLVDAAFQKLSNLPGQVSRSLQWKNP